MRRRSHCARLLRSLLLASVLVASTVGPGRAEEIRSFAELEAAGAVVGAIAVDTHNIFDLDDPRENRFVYRAANALHIKTRASLIRRLLLFKSGERVSVRVIEETERLIRASGTVYDVAIRPAGYRGGVVDVEVATRDTWTLQPGLKVRRAGGVNTGAFALKEQNLAGSGTTLGIERRATVDRTGTVLQLANEHLFDGWTSVNLERASFDDGSSAAFGLARPFYALDTRWAAAVSASKFERVDSIYAGGSIAGQYRHRQNSAEAYGGWSRGLAGRWARRYSAGLSYQGDSYERDPARQPPPLLPPDKTLAGPFLRYEALEDDFLELRNRERIQRPEYFAMGYRSTVQVGRSLAALGATEQPWQLSASVSKGSRVPGGRELLTSASYAAQYGSATGDARSLSGAARYYAPQGSFLFFLGVSADAVKAPTAADELLLGGDNGLRGYPLRYQRGTRRVLLTAEERFYSDWYPLRVFRLGGAVFYDLGRAWGGSAPNASPGWLGNVGFGLRAISARSSFGNVLHLDVAVPLHKTDPGIRSWQFLVTTAKNF